MKIFKNYLLKQISNSFFPIFLTLFFITSIVYLVKIASLTSIIKIDFLELMLMYSYSLANILFLTLPISFFAASIIALSKLSSEYELIIFTSFGLKPFEILKMIFPALFFLCIALLILAMDLIPKSEYLNAKFLSYKQAQASFNIKASEYGQSFGDWLIYMEDSKNGKYDDIKLFTTQDQKDQFIIAKNASINNLSTDINLELENGKTLIIEPSEINQINFKKMYLYQSIENEFIEPFTNTFDYWTSKLADSDRVLRKFNFYVLISIFPLISMFLILQFSYFNPRFDKNRSSIYIIVSATLYYILAYYLSKSIAYYSLAVLPLLWLSISYFIYAKKVKPLY